MKFKVGDRVALYTFNGREAPFYVDNVMSDLLALKQSKKDKTSFGAHPKQCRRLKKKVRRRIWVNKNMIDASCAIHGVLGVKVAGDGWIEFVEAKK